MERKKLAEEIISFCSKYKLFKNMGSVGTSASRLAEQLESNWFVEHLIFTLLTETKYDENVDLEKLEELLKELEKIRLDLEYGE